MKILDFAQNVLNVPLTFHQKDLLTLLDDKQGNIQLVKPRTQGMLVVQEIYRKYNEVIAS